MIMTSKLINIYTHIVDNLRSFPRVDLLETERFSIILENVLDDYSKNVECLNEDEWNHLYDQVSFYYDTVLGDARFDYYRS